MKNILKVPDRENVFTKKTSLKSIIKDQHYLYVKHIIEDIADKVNKLTIHAYFFLKLWILHLFKETNEIPIIKTETITIIFKILTIRDNRGIRPKESNLHKNLQKFYDEEYHQFHQGEKIKIKGISQILEYVAKDMITNIKNNIKIHFLDYLRCYVNGYYKDLTDYSNYSSKDKWESKRQHKNELYKVKNDLINNTETADEKYRKFISFHEAFILPNRASTTLTEDVKINPQKYLLPMIKMNQTLEWKGRKQFNILPLRTSSMIKYFPIDTTTLIRIFINDKRSDLLLSKISTQADEFWDRYFKINDDIFKKKDYHFNHMIYTDGVGVSILFRSYTNNLEKTSKFSNFAKAKKAINEDCVNKTPEEVEEYKINFNKQREAKNEAFENKRRNKKEENKQKYKKLSKEEKLLLEKAKPKEFPYLEDLSEKQLHELKKYNLVYVDPGKIRLYTMIDDKGNTLKYSNREYMKRSKRLEYNELLTNLREKLGITEQENTLAGYNSKSCDYNTFKDYLTKKTEINPNLLEKYKEHKFRQYQWYSYIGKQRETSRLVNKIKETYGRNCKLMMGDWSPSVQMRNFVSTPMIGLKRKLRKHFEIINLDEFRTSKLNCHTEEVCENLWLPKKIITKEGKEIIKSIKLHSVLTYKMKNKRKGCINRDINSVLNMKKIVDSWLKTRSRPENFSRNKKALELELIKTIQPCTCQMDTMSKDL